MPDPRWEVGSEFHWDDGALAASPQDWLPAPHALFASGSGALTTYALAKRLARRPETADLAPHVADMRRLLKRPRKAKAETPGNTPAPTPQPSGK